MANDCRLEKLKKPYIGLGLPNLHEIWSGDAYWPSDWYGS